MNHDVLSITRKHIPSGCLLIWLLTMINVQAQCLFEDTFASWTNNFPVGWKGSIPQNIIRDDSEAKAGKSIVVLSPNKACGYSEMLQRKRIPVESNTIYQFSILYQKETNCSIPCFMQFFLKNGEFPLTSGGLFTTGEGAPNWTETNVLFAAYPGADEMALKLTGSGDGKIRIGKLSISKKGLRDAPPASPKELLANPDFESCAPGNILDPKGAWHVNATTNLVVLADASRAHGGDKFVFIESAPGSEATLTSEKIMVDFQKRYRLSLWARGEGKATLSVYQYPSPGSHGFAGKYTVTDKWKEYSGIYVPSSDIVAGGVIAINIGGDIFIDDISFKEIE